MGRGPRVPSHLRIACVRAPAAVAMQQVDILAVTQHFTGDFKDHPDSNFPGGRCGKVLANRETARNAARGAAVAVMYVRPPAQCPFTLLPLPQNCTLPNSPAELIPVSPTPTRHPPSSHSCGPTQA